MNHANNNSISTIFFDVGGVLTVDFIEKKIMDLANKYNQDYDRLLQSKKKYRPLADLGQISENEFWTRVLNDFNIIATEDDVDVAPYIEEIDGVFDIVRMLKQNGYQVAVLSNDSIQLGEGRRKKFNYDELFQDVIISSRFGVVKPEPAIYEIALKRLHAAPNESIFIDDRMINLEGAERVGIKAILFTNADQLKKDLINLGLKLT